MSGGDGEGIGDLFVATLLLKLKILEETEASVVEGDVFNLVTRVAVVLEGFRSGVWNKILDTEPQRKDIEKVAELAKEKVDVVPEDILLLAKVRRFVVEGVKKYGLVNFIRMATGDDSEYRRYSVVYAA